MNVINIPKLGTVIWDKSLDYSKLLKQIVDLENQVSWLNQVHEEREKTLLSHKDRIIRQSNELKQEKATNKELFEYNEKLHHQLTKLKKETVYHWLGLVFICLVSITINILY